MVRTGRWLVTADAARGDGRVPRRRGQLKLVETQSDAAPAEAAPSRVETASTTSLARIYCR